MIEDEDKPKIHMLEVPEGHWIHSFYKRFPDGARWNEDLGDWEAVEPGDFDAKWAGDDLEPL